VVAYLVFIAAQEWDDGRDGKQQIKRGLRSIMLDGRGFLLS